jgi:hypothetical protein
MLERIVKLPNKGMSLTNVAMLIEVAHDQLGDAFAGAHDARGRHGFVGGDEHEAVHFLRISIKGTR